MIVISRKTLKEFWDRHPDAEKALQAWFHEAENASWKNSGDVKAMYGSASILTAGRVVFNICGNKYRLVVHIRYDFQRIFVRFVGTHKEYDRIDAETV
jgi:mRNA interferase HigB